MNSQTISGTIFSKEENKPIPYVKIGIENQNIGAIANEKGAFSIDLSTINPKKNIIIEVSGYEKYSVPVENFIKNNNQTIFLEDRVKDIQEVKIIPKKYVDKNWGVNSKTKKVQFNHTPSRNKEDLSKEVAIELSTRKKAKIQKINLNIPIMTADRPVFVRFNVYDENFNSIVLEDISTVISPESIIDDTFTINVADKNIWVKNKFFVGLQILNYFEGSLTLSGVPFKPAFYRNYLGNWEKVPVVCPAINIDVKVEK